MAKVHNNVMIRGLRGALGNQLVVKTDKAGRTIVSNKPVFARDRVFTPAQRAQQERFRAARAYAREAKHLEIYKSKAMGTPHTPSNIAMTDWFHPPEIQEIDLSAWTGQAGQVIRIRAVDDVQVTQVRVLILDEDETVLEEGSAVMEAGEWWMYQATVIPRGNLKVLARVEDRPKHAAEMIKSLS